MMRLAFLAAAVAVLGCGQGSKPASPPAASTPSVFETLQADIFSPKCSKGAACHEGDRAGGQLDLSPGRSYDALVRAKASRRPERFRVVPGEPEASYLLDRVVEGREAPLMPFGGQPLESADVDRIRAWIQGGAVR